MKRPGLAIVLMLLAGAPARADRLDEAWRHGNEAYLHGDYAAAVAAYEELDRRGVVSGDLYFNLGDAYFKKGALGPAIWSFERALALDPGDEDARYNLDQARKLAARAVTDKLEGETHEAPWIRVVTALSPSTETWLFVLTYVGFFVVLGFRTRAHADSRPALTAGATVLAAAALLSGALLAGRAQLDRIPFGVVLPDAVAFKDGADVNYKTAFEAHAGLRVRIIDRDQDWLRVRLGNGLEGWVRSQDIGRL
jgi:tetratricopeptide (TPR) repeat protein